MEPPAKPKVIFIDDELDFADSLVAKFSDLYEAQGFVSADEALKFIDESVAVVVADHKMRGMQGVELLARLRKEKPDIGRILMTAVADAIPLDELVNEARPHYVPKTGDFIDHLASKLAGTVELFAMRSERRRRRAALKLERNQLRATVRVKTEHERYFSDIIGNAPALRAALKIARLASDNLAPVLITGETGTGKDYLARAIHFDGELCAQAFRNELCSIYLPEVLQSRLFGHEKDSFTGAHQKTNGIFRDAEGGTVFLDGIGDMSLDVQKFFLEFLEYKRIQPLGYTKGEPIIANVRVICATHKDLESEVQAGRFRDDLFRRIRKAINIHMPALRDRRADIPLLTRHFMIIAARSLRLNHVPIGALVDEYLQSQSYPGNLRQLDQIIWEAMINMWSDAATTLDIKYVRRAVEVSHSNSATPAILPLKLARKDFTKGYVEASLLRNNYNMIAAAKELGMTDRNLRILRKLLKIRPEK